MFRSIVNILPYRRKEEISEYPIKIPLKIIIYTHEKTVKLTCQKRRHKLKMDCKNTAFKRPTQFIVPLTRSMNRFEHLTVRAEKLEMEKYKVIIINDEAKIKT